MAKRKVVWSPRAYNELMGILEFFNERNGNTRYSQKLLNKIENTLATLSENEWIGKKTKDKDLRVLVMKDYSLFYTVGKTSIRVQSFWDNRQNPGKERI